MTRANREWKSFDERWGRNSGLQGFLGWSVLVHGILLLGVGIPAGYLHAEHKHELDQVRQQEQAQQEEEKKKIIEEAQAEARAEFKEEIAREQLEQLFRGLVQEQLPATLAEEYWDELLADLDPDLSELANELAGEDSEPVMAGQKVQAIKEKLVGKLAEMIARDQHKPLREEAIARAREEAGKLAEFYKKELPAKVGHPAGAMLNQLVESAGNEATKRLQQAGKDVALALESANKAADALAAAAVRLETQKKALAVAGDQKDAKAEAALKAQVRREQAGLLAVGKTVALARTSMNQAADQLAASLPKTADNLRKSAGAGSKAQEKTESAAKASADARPDTAGADAKGAKDILQRTSAALKEAQGEIQRQLKAASPPDRLAMLKAADALRTDKLAKQADDKFAQMVKDKVLPAVLQKTDQAIDRQLKDKNAAPGIKAAVQREVAKVVGKDLLGQVKAGEKVAKAAGEKLPARPPAGKDKVDPGQATHAAQMAKAAEAKLMPAVDKNLAAVVDAGLKQMGAVTLAPKGDSSAARAALLQRLESLKTQLAAGRKDFLGQPNGVGLATAQARQQTRQAGLGSLRRGGALRLDLEAYKKVVEKMKDRGRVVGFDLPRTGAEGEAAKAEDDRSLRPALVYLPESQAESPQETPPQERKVAPPTFPTNNFAGVPFLADDAIKIDGDLADWKSLPALKLFPVAMAGPKPAATPEQQTAWLAYCPRGLLIAVQVTDTTGKLENHHPNSSFWLNDAIEIYLDTLNSKYTNRGEMNTHQFFAFPLGRKDDTACGGYESLFSLNDKQQLDWKFASHAQSALPRAGKAALDGKGWTMEMLIPKPLLRHGEIKPGRIIGFNLQVDSGSGVYYFWTNPIKGRISMKPNSWGDIQFLGSDAKLEIVAADGKEPLSSLLPGQSCRVRVTDPDMNLDDQKKDKVSVTVRAASGDTDTVILEETENQSGIFVGSLPTRLNIGTRKPGVLSVFEGEAVTVEYQDQARAYGERNVPVKASFGVRSIGSKLAQQ